MYCLDTRLDKILLTLPCLCGTRKFCCSVLNSSLLALRLHGLFTKERFSKYGRPTHLVSDWENSHHFFIQSEAKPKEHKMLARLLARFASGVKICLEFWLVRRVLWVLRDWQINYFCFGLTTRYRGRCCGLMVSALESALSGLGSSSDRGHRVVFLGKTLHSHSASVQSCG